MATFPQQTHEVKMCKSNTDSADFHGFTRIGSWENPRKSVWIR